MLRFRGASLPCLPAVRRVTFVHSRVLCARAVPVAPVSEAPHRRSHTFRQATMMVDRLGMPGHAGLPTSAAKTAVATQLRAPVSRIVEGGRVAADVPARAAAVAPIPKVFSATADIDTSVWRAPPEPGRAWATGTAHIDGNAGDGRSVTTSEPARDVHGGAVGLMRTARASARGSSGRLVRQSGAAAATSEGYAHSASERTLYTHLGDEMRRSGRRGSAAQLVSSYGCGCSCRCGPGEWHS